MVSNSFKKNVLLFMLTFLVAFYFIKSNLINYKVYKQLLLNQTKAELSDDKAKYKFKLNPKWKICEPVKKHKRLLLISFVVIAPNQFEKRELIRKTWANSTLFPETRVIFTIGLTNDKLINNKIIEESLKHNDLLQIDFIDSYFNMTIKIISSFYWISTYCSNSKFILRINDDVVVNMFSLVKYLREASKQNATNTMFGNVLNNGIVIRDPHSKFYIKTEEFAKSNYEPYCDGSAYILTQDLARTYYDLALVSHLPPFSVWLEDVYLGMLGHKVNTKLVNIVNSFVPTNQYDLLPKETKLSMAKNKGGFGSILFIYELNEFEYFWNFISISSLSI